MVHLGPGRSNRRSQSKNAVVNIRSGDEQFYEAMDSLASSRGPDKEIVEDFNNYLVTE